MRHHPMAAGFLGGILVTLLLGLALWLGVVYSGGYNVAASAPHRDWVRWSLDTTMHRSVARHAESVRLPENFPDQLVAQGAVHYAETCVHCHGAPGQEAGEFTQGMRPEPPLLAEAAVEWTPQELHWIIDNGIRMTGMPAFGPHHSDEEILALTAFVAALPGMGEEAYQQLAETQSAAAGG